MCHFCSQVLTPTGLFNPHLTLLEHACSGLLQMGKQRRGELGVPPPPHGVSRCVKVQS